MSLSKLLSDSAKKRRQNVSSIRFNIQQKLFTRFNLRTVSPTCTGTQIPKLWCPPICHYKASSTTTPDIDMERNCIHLGHLSKHIGGYLVNGSSGDGWTLTTQQQQRILNGILHFMHKDLKHLTPILIGALAHDYNSKMSNIRMYADVFQTFYNTENMDEIYKQSPFVGFAITPPSNTCNQKEIEECLADIISAYKQYPFALYQIPQITNSEMSPQTVSNLISRFGNIIMLKDSSGADTILKSQRCLDGVFMVRGAEGNHMEALLNVNYGVAGYNGLLLSTANNYALELNLFVDELMHGNWGNAQRLSELITTVSTATFGVVSEYEFGNWFTNSAKMVDHFMAYGGKWGNVEDIAYWHTLPITENGTKYDVDDMWEIKEILVANGFLGDAYVGYMNQTKKWWKKH